MSLTNTIQGRFSCGGTQSPVTAMRRHMTVVRAEVVNPNISKHEAKLVHTVDVTQLSKPVTAFCRCWRSKSFPHCDGSHVKHNETTGDNVGPLELKKQ